MEKYDGIAEVGRALGHGYAAAGVLIEMGMPEVFPNAVPDVVKEDLAVCAFKESTIKAEKKIATDEMVKMFKMGFKLYLELHGEKKKCDCH